ncbi:caspase, EACC1-associated type [Streptomyces sp. NPDC004752]
MTPRPDRINRSGSRAVLIGVSKYQDPSFPPVPSAEKSLRGLHQMLVNEESGGWPQDRVTCIPDPVDCRRVISDLRHLAQETYGVLLVYFVGHGTVTANGDLVLAVTDTIAEEADVTGLEYSKIRSALLGSPAKVKAVVLDCCYSGRAIDILAGDGNFLADSTDIRGTYTLTAADRVAHAGQAGACTAFTGELLDLISTGIAGGPPVLTFAELYPHLRRRLIASNLPHPNQRGTDTADKCPVAKNASITTPSAGQATPPVRPGAPDRAADTAPPSQHRKSDAAAVADLSSETRLPSPVGPREVSGPQLKALVGEGASRAKLPAPRRGIRRRALVLGTLAVVGTGAATAAVMWPRRDDGGDDGSGGNAGASKTTSKLTGERIGTVVFSPDGKTIATSADTLRLWDVQTRRSISVNDGQRYVPIAFSPDGKTLATGDDSMDRAGVQLRDPATGVITADLTSDGVRGLAFSPDGKTLAGGAGWDDEGQCWLWDVTTGRLSMTVLKEPTVSVVFSPDGSTFATGGRRGVRLWNSRSGRAVTTFTSEACASVAFGPHGKTLVTGGVGGVRVWDTRTGRLIAKLTGNTTNAVAVSPDGRAVAAGTSGQGFPGLTSQAYEKQEYGFWLLKLPESAPTRTP